MQNQQQLDLLCQKGVFPYRLMREDFNAFIQLDKLPAREDFYNELTQRHITKAEYRRAQKTFAAFDCQSMGDYLMVWVQRIAAKSGK